ncbi:unnamed protein product [Camellia sinensis]
MLKFLMESLATKKPHAIFIPFPAQGHVNPMMQLAKLLHSRGFYITFVNTEFNHSRLVQSRGPNSVKDSPFFKFQTIPDGVPPSNPNATQSVTSLLYYTQKHSLAPLRDLIRKLNSLEDSPPVSVVISDGIMSFAIEVAEELGIPEFQFWTASSCGFMAYLQFVELPKRALYENDITNGYLNTLLDWIPGMKNMRMKDMPSFVRSTNPNDIAFNRWLEEAQNNLKSHAIVFNAFSEFEHEVLEAITSIFPRIYTVGPLSLLCKSLPENEVNSRRSSLWKESNECTDWLDKQGPNSVVYVNFGSIAVMSDKHLEEFAWGLTNSGYPFLWIVRSDLVMGESTMLPESFVQETKDRCLIASWCPQDQVLSHPSIGVFLTHIGWNSTLEGVCGGVPMICWPFFAEQQVNCRYACTTWGIGVEIEHDVKREQVQDLVSKILEGEEGKKLRNKAMDWKKKAEAAVIEGGSSYNNFNLLVEELLQMSLNHRKQCG